MGLLLIVLSVFLLAYIRQAIQQTVTALVILLGGTVKLGLVVYSVLFLPGIMLHEISHFLMASLLGVRTGEIELFPSNWPLENERVALGSVKIAKTDFIRESLIGLAPFLSGMTALVSLVHICLIPRFSLISLSVQSLLSYWPLPFSLTEWLTVYFIIMIANTLFTSKEDARSWPAIIILCLTLIILFYVLGGSLAPLIGLLARSTLLVDSTAVAFLFVLIIDSLFLSGLFLCKFLLESISHKKVRFGH